MLSLYVEYIVRKDVNLPGNKNTNFNTKSGNTFLFSWATERVHVINFLLITFIHISKNRYVSLLSKQLMILHWESCLRRRECQSPFDLRGQLR